MNERRPPCNPGAKIKGYLYGQDLKIALEPTGIAEQADKNDINTIKMR
jgi:hypothetical protein